MRVVNFQAVCKTAPLPVWKCTRPPLKPKSWTVATAALVAILMTFGAGWITPVALKDIAAEVGDTHSVPALATAMVWLGSGVGGIMMGRIADRIGTRWTISSAP